MPDQLTKEHAGRAKAAAVSLATELTQSELIGKIDWQKVLPFLFQLLQQLLPLILPTTKPADNDAPKSAP